MRGRTFETFQVTSGNREAFELCRRIAALEEMGPSLALLLGPENCGKSHLLWAVAKQIRLSTIPVGLALITPNDFPDKVRGLVEDPRPLQGRRAVLLVDNLEGFEREARRLEALIDTFLNHQHPVIVASNVHPNRLRQLSGSLRARLARSNGILVEPRVLEGESPLENFEKIEALEKRVADLEQERDGLQEKLRVAFASAEDLAKEAVETEKRLHALQEEADYAMAQQARSQIALSDARMQLEETNQLRDKLAERDRQLASAEACVSSALQRLEEMRAAHAEHRDALLSNIGAMADELAAPENEAPLLRALAEAGRDQEHVRAALTATRERLKRVEFEWEKTRKVLAIQTAEMDALRYNAASQVASANIQAGELEHRMDQVTAALAEVDAISAAIGPRAADDSAVQRLRDAVARLQAQVAAIQQARDGLEETTAAQDELSVFDTDFFEALPEDFENSHSGGSRQVFLPGVDAGLRETMASARGNAPQDGRDTPFPEAGEQASGQEVPEEDAGSAPADGGATSKATEPLAEAPAGHRPDEGALQHTPPATADADPSARPEAPDTAESTAVGEDVPRPDEHGG